MQAMEHDRNHAQPNELSRASARETRVPGAPEPDEVMRWITAGVVAAAALLGLVVLVAIASLALQPPGWVQVILGVLMAAGAVVFAWLVASALRKDDTTTRRR